MEIEKTMLPSNRAPVDFDQPNMARAFDAMLGGRDNYAADRALVAEIEAMAPGLRQATRDHRAWVGRVLRLLAGERGVDQFVDLGSGLPTADNTHQIVQRVNPEAHVVYVDSDPVVQAYGRALLEENDRTHVAGCDLTDPDRALTDPDLAPHIDFDRPVAIVMAAITHHIQDDERAAAVVRGWMDRVVPGSYLVLSHQCDPDDGGEASTLAKDLMVRFSQTEVGARFRTPAAITAYFDGLDLIPPGVVPVHTWWPDGPRLLPLTPLSDTVIGGAAEKR